MRRYRTNRPRRALLASFAAGCALLSLTVAMAAGRTTLPEQVSPGSKYRIAYAAGGQIHIIAADGSGDRAITSGDSPSWSPDGRVLVFQSARIAGNGLDLYLINADGTLVRRVVTHPGEDTAGNAGNDFDPAWAPNTDTIAFTSDRDGNNELYSTNSVGHALSRLTIDQAKDRDPSWSPDGTRIAFVSDREGNDDIYTMRSDGTVRRVTRDPGADDAPAWSPDGRTIAFQSSRDGNWEIYTISSDGTDPHRLTNNSVSDINPSWSPDGESIAFTSGGGDSAGGGHLVVINSAGGVARALTAPGQPADHAAWRPAVDLAVTVSGPRRIPKGHTARLRIAIRNLSPAPAFTVTLTGSIPPDSRGVRARASAGACTTSRPLRCVLPTVTSASPSSIELTLRPGHCGRMEIRPSVSGLEMDPDTANNRARLRLQVVC
jgi:Tol biopolymer transport system component